MIDCYFNCCQHNILDPVLPFLLNFTRVISASIDNFSIIIVDDSLQVEVPDEHKYIQTEN